MSWTETDTTSDAFILNKPTLPADATTAGEYVFMQIGTGDPVSLAGVLATLGGGLTYANNVLASADTDTTYTAGGTGLTLTGTVFSIDNPLPAPAESNHRQVLMVIDSDPGYGFVGHC